MSGPAGWPRAPSVAGVGGSLALLVLLGAAAANANPWLLGGLWGCPFKELTGLPCATCGITRVLLLLAEGEWLAAARPAPLPFFLGVLCLAAGAWQLVARARSRPLPDDVVPRWFRPLWMKGLLVVWVVALWGYAIARSLATGAP
jgi:hypothetical protein